MKLAYHCHYYTLLRIREASTIEEKQLLALNYFLYDAEIVDEEMKKTLEELR